MITLPSTTAEHEAPPTVVIRALAEELTGVAKVLRAGSPPNSSDACLQQLREVVSRAQRSVDLATASVELSSNYTVEDLEALHLQTRERIGLAVVEIKSAEMRNAAVEKALRTQRKAAAAAAAVEAVGRSARSSKFRILSSRVIQPQPSTESLQQATADGHFSVVLPTSDVDGARRCAVPSANEGVAALTHVAAREEGDASTRLTRALEFDPEMTRVAYATGLSMLYVLLLCPHCTPPAW